MSRQLLMAALGVAFVLPAASADAGLFDLFRRRPAARQVHRVQPRYVAQPQHVARPRAHVRNDWRRPSTAAISPNAVPTRAEIPGFPDFVQDFTYTQGNAPNRVRLH
ncbi:MAG: hypothetical protein AAF532_11950 [Planctomycetota bacterium]